MDPVKAVCRRDYYPAFHQDGHRSEDVIKWIVLHSTEGGTAESIARYFASSSAGGSTHLVVDDDSCQRCLANTTIPRGAPGANTQGFHIEQCGYARWTKAEWLQHKGTLERAAYKTALHCKKFGIPATFRTALGLKRGYQGVTTHYECTQAFGGGTHWDPGSGWPRTMFMDMVRMYLREMA